MTERILSGTILPTSLRRRYQDYPVIIYYHGVVADALWRDWETADMVRESAFRQHLNLYRRYYNVVPLRAIVRALAGSDAPLPPRALAITFDDGFKNNVRYAVPALKEHGFVATFFLTTGFLDTSADLWWLPLKRCFAVAQRDGRTLELPRIGAFGTRSAQEALHSYRKALDLLKGLCSDARLRMIEDLRRNCPLAGDPLNGVYDPLSWAEVRQMADQGMEIGAHSVTHPILSREPPEKAKQEILASVHRISQELPHTEIPFSYPNGQREDFTPAIEQMVREVGCCAAVAGFPGFNRKGDDVYQLRRFPIGGHHSVESVELDLCGLLPTVRHLCRPFMRVCGKDV